MALWTRGQLKTIIRQELMDPNKRWWVDSELEMWINNWQTDLQHEFELVGATSTQPTSGPTIDMSNTDIHRLDADYWNGLRLAGRGLLEREYLFPLLS